MFLKNHGVSNIVLYLLEYQVLTCIAYSNQITMVLNLE